MKYLKPKTEIIKIETISLICSSTLCDCYEYRERRGCFGCEGGCGCNHWEGDKLIPGC